MSLPLVECAFALLADLLLFVFFSSFSMFRQQFADLVSAAACCLTTRGSQLYFFTT